MRRPKKRGPGPPHLLMTPHHAGNVVGLDPHKRTRSSLTSRQHLVNEAEPLLCELPLALREQLPATKAVRPRLAALEHRNRRRRYDAPTRLRLQLLDGYRAQIIALDREEKQV